MKLIHLLYRSVAAKPMALSDLIVLLEVSRDHNARHDITGMLIYNNQQFMQLLEGPEQNVKDLYGRIEKDVRHHDVRLSYLEAADARFFPDWSMAFEKMGYLTSVGVQGLARLSEKIRKHPEKARAVTPIRELMDFDGA